MIETRDEQIATDEVDNTNDGGSGAKLGDFFVKSLPVRRKVCSVEITGGKSDIKVTILIKTPRGCFVGS